jgi:hypothetical protein
VDIGRPPLVRFSSINLAAVNVRAARLLCAPLVRLEGCAAGAELLRLAARVFELRSRVGVDELAGLDPLEAVTF